MDSSMTSPDPNVSGPDDIIMCSHRAFPTVCDASCSESRLVPLAMAAVRSLLCSLESARTKHVMFEDHELDRLMPPSSFQPDSNNDVGDTHHIDKRAGGGSGEIITSRYFSIPILSEPSSALFSNDEEGGDFESRTNREKFDVPLSEQQIMDTLSRKRFSMRSRHTAVDRGGNSEGAPFATSGCGAELPTTHTTSFGYEPSKMIAEILTALGEHATPEVHVLCGLVRAMCVPAGSSAASTAPAASHVCSQDTVGSGGGGGGCAPDSSSECGGGGAGYSQHHCGELDPQQLQFALAPGHRFWFRHQDCQFSTLRLPGATVNPSELQFMLDVAFHCPVSPVAKLFQLLLHSLDVGGKIPQRYHACLIGTRGRQRRASAPCGSGEHATVYMERRRVPPPSIPLTEYVQFLELMDAAYFDPQYVPRPLSCCSRLQMAATTRNAILGEIFLEMGEVCNYYRVLSGFPTILADHHRSMQFLMLHPEGPISLEERFMVAIMSASRHRCEYLVRRFSAGLLAFANDAGRATHFLKNGPQDRLKLLQPLIGILAHQPWTVSTTNIEEAVGSGLWSIPELMQAMCIVCTVLPLCGLTMGLGVPTEIGTYATLPTDVFPHQPSPTFPVCARYFHSVDEMSPPHDAATCCSPTAESRGSGPVEKKEASSRSTRNCDAIDYLRYCGADKVVTVARINRSTNVQPHSISEYSFGWQNGAAYFVEQYYPQFAELLSYELAAMHNVIAQQQQQDEAVTAISRMIQKKVVHSDAPLGRAPFSSMNDLAAESGGVAFAWRALRLYILNLIGITADDFPYEAINKVLTRGAKTFAQKSFGYPDRLSLADLTDWPGADGASKAEAGETSCDAEEDGCRWFNEEVILVLVAIFTCMTRREGLMVTFLSTFAAYQRCM